MIRAKLVEARERRGWTQEYLARLLNVDAATIYRWEYGESKPQGRNRRKLCETLEINEYDIDLIGGQSSPVTPATTILGCDTLENKLLACVLQWPRNCAKYTELQTKIRLLAEGPMDKERRKALQLTATLVINGFSLSPLKAAISIAAEELLPWMASGLMAAWKLSRASDLAVADMVAATYLPTLVALSSDARHRKYAAALAAQGFLLRETMAWHLSSNNDACMYALQAEEYAAISKDIILQADALRRAALTYYYGRNYEAALVKAEEGRYFVEHNAVPSSMKCHAYFDLATYQARCGMIDESVKYRRLAARYHSNEVPAPYMGSVGNEVSLLRVEGLVLASAGMHGEAVDLYEQANEVMADQPIAERNRLDLLNCQLRSLLKQKDRSKEQCVPLWLDALSSAQALQSEQRFNESCHLLEIMEAVWPGEKDIAELREVATHW